MSRTSSSDSEMSLSELNKVIRTQLSKELDRREQPGCKKSRFARIFEWFDMVLSKMTRLWMYLLEIAGISWIFHLVWKFNGAITSVATANTAFELERAAKTVEAVKTSAESTYLIVLGICAAIPGIIAALRSKHKKWKMEAGQVQITTTTGDGDSYGDYPEDQG